MTGGIAVLDSEILVHICCSLGHVGAFAANKIECSSGGFVIAGDDHHMTLYREDVPVLLRPVPEPDLCDLRPSRRLSACYMYGEKR